MKSKFLLFAIALLLGIPFEANAQLVWSSYNTSGTRVSASAATYDSATGTYTFTIPANTTHTFVTTNIAPVTLAASQTKTVTFAMHASGGFGGAGSPVINQRFFAYGLFNYGATAPGVSGSFTDDLGLWTDSYNQTTAVASEVFGGISTTANLLGYANTRQLGAGAGPSPGAVGQFTNNSTTNVTFRVVENASGTASIGTGTGTAVAGASYQDAATGGTTLNRTIYSAGAAAPNGATTFNEFAFLFYNSTGSAVTLTLSNIAGVTPPPIITTQPPATSSATTGSNLTISVVATGATSYQWRKSTDGGANFTPISGNATATTAALTLSNVTAADAGVYNVVVTNAAGSVTSTSDTVTITTGVSPPSISTPPASATVLVGGSASFSVTAGGTNPLSYQWSKSTDGGANYGEISGATSATYSISSVALSDAGSYRAVVTNSAGSATSNAAVLTVQQAPAITAQPVGATIAAGASYTTSVTATGTPAPTYQWRLNGTNVAGATSPSYTITNASGANAGNYTCVVTNAVTSVTSNAAYVGVLSAMTATALTPSNGATGKNRDVLLTITFNQAVSAGTTGRIRIYDASAPATPVETIDMSTATSLTQFGTPYRYMLKTISGSAFAYLPILINGNTATICPRSSTALAYNKTYYVNIEPGVLLDSTGATFGGISNSTTWAFSTKASGPVSTAASITAAADGSGDFDTVQGAVDFIPFSPANTIARTVTIKDGTYNELVRLRSGQNLVTMQGQSRAGTTIQYLTNNNSTNLLPLLGSSFGSIGQRSVFGADPNDFTLQNITLRNTTPYTGSQAECFWVGNNAQRMTVSQANILSYQDTFMSNGGVCYLTNCYVEGSVDFIWGSGYTFFNNCELKMVGQTSGGIYVQARNTPSTVPGYFFYNCQLTKGAGVTANGTYLARVDPNTSGGYPYSQVVWMNCKMDTHIIAAGWQLNNATTAPTIKYWEYQSVALDGTTPINITSRPTYNNAATGVGGSTLLNNQQLDSASATYFSNATNAIGWWPRPAIATQPASVNATVGQSAGFSVTATSPLAQTYQWKKDGVDIGGATSSSYLIPSVTTGSAGTYSVTITNPAGGTTSSGAVLTVQSLIDAWRVANFGSAAAPAAANTADPDGDSVQNVVEFAFGMDPNVNSNAPLVVSGASLLQHGMPTVNVDTQPTTVNYTARFIRRKDWSAASLTYAVQFSGDLTTWQTSAATFTVIAQDATHEAVSVPYPFFVNGRKARFFRVVVTAP